MATKGVFRALALAALLVADGLAAVGPARAADALVALGDELAVGKNRTGESCKLRLMEIRAEPPYSRYALFCEGWTQPSGELRRFGVAQGYTVEKLLTDSLFEKSFSTRLGACGNVEPTTLAMGTPAALRECKLDADWVVLSACNTAAPDGRLGGQSLSGLARAFFYAYGKNAALGRGAALRTAQLKLMDDQTTSHPSFWAPFILVGDGGTL